MTWQNQAYFADVTIKVLQAMDLYFHTKREKVKTDLNDEAWRLPFFTVTVVCRKCMFHEGQYGPCLESLCCINSVGLTSTQPLGPQTGRI